MLERWKAALEKNGLPCTMPCGEVLQVEFPGPRYQCYSDHPGQPFQKFDANFREAVKNHVFGANSFFAPCRLGMICDDVDWHLMQLPDQPATSCFTIGRGTDQNEALLVALEGRL